MKWAARRKVKTSGGAKEARISKEDMVRALEVGACDG